MEKLKQQISKAAKLAAEMLPPDQFNDVLVWLSNALIEEYNKRELQHLVMSECQALDEYTEEEYSFSCSLRKELQYA